MNVKFLLLLCFPATLFGQSKESSFPQKSVMEIYPISASYIEGLSIGQGINMYGEFNPKFSIVASLHVVLFRKLDARHNFFEDKAPFPRNWQGDAHLGYTIFENNSSKKPSKSNKLSALLGFNFLQYGSSESDYWILDSIPDKGFQRINGFYYLSAKAGLHYQLIRNDESDESKIISKHSFQFSYLFGLDGSLSVNYDNQKSEKIYKPIELQRNGVQFNYNYVRRISKKIGISVGAEFMYSPILKYLPNSKYYSPRGGEGITPFFPTLKLGICFFD